MCGRSTAITTTLIAMFCVSACGGGTNRSPAAPSTAISVAQESGTTGPNIGASSVSWSCFTHASGTTGTFGSSGCPAPRVTTSRFLPAATGAAISAPGAPTNLSGTVSGSIVTLTWTAPAGVDAPTSYLVQAGSSAGLTDLANFDTGTAATSLAVFNVPAGTYFIRIRATNSAGTSGPSNEFQLAVAAAAPCGSLSAPTGLLASVTGSTVVLTWATPAGCTPTSYIIQAGSTPGASDLANFSTGSTATTFTATSVGAGTYYIRILSAAGGVFSAPSTEIAFAVGGCATGPSAPTNLRSSVSGSTVVLTWDAATGVCPATSYILQAGSSSGASNLANSPVSGTSLTATDVGNGTYYIRVLAVNAAGQSPSSAEIVVTVGPVAPTTLVAAFQMFDPATQSAPTIECRFRSATGQTSTCTLRSTSFPLGANTIVSYSWTVRYTYDTEKTLTQSGSTPTLAITDICGLNGSTADGAVQPLSVSLTVTDNLGATATATSGSGSQPAVQLRLFTCGS